MFACAQIPAPCPLAGGDGENSTRFRPWRLAVYLVVSLAVIGLYDVAAHWPFPFRVFTLSNLIPEYLLIAAVLVIPYYQARAWTRPACYAGLVVVFVAYGSFDIFRFYFKAAPRPSDLQNTALIWDFAPMLAVATLATWFSAAAFYVGSVVGGASLYPRERRAWMIVRRGVALAALAGLMGGPVFDRLLAITYKDVYWSQDLTVSLNGRFSTFAKLGLEERAAAKALGRQTFFDPHVMDRVYPGVPTRTPNIYVIVLESFLDPRLVRGATYNRSPLADEMRPFLIGGEHFSQVLSPTYGGNSVNAEFELLTGVRSLCRVASVDFNVMRGGRTDGLVNRLKQHGYRVHATKASSSGYFNVRRAYESLGFEDAVFMGDEKRTRHQEAILFDGDFFDLNLRTVRERAATHEGPSLHYMVGMYGHFPYADDYAKRPRVIETGHPDEAIRRIANQFYHRTKALGLFLSDLKASDPDGIYCVISDHLPPVFDKKVEYIPGSKYVNIALLIDGGEILDVSGRRYHEISQLLWDRLTENKERVALNEAAMEAAYMQLLSASRSAAPH